MKISKKKPTAYRRRIVAADEDDRFDDFSRSDDAPQGDMFGDNMDDGDVGDAIDDLQDSVDDLQDSMDDITEDDPTIDVDNNIVNHYIAECDKCKGIFISAMVESDQQVDSINGVCPLCEKESEQIFKWVVKSIDSDPTEM